MITKLSLAIGMMLWSSSIAIANPQITQAPQAANQKAATAKSTLKEMQETAARNWFPDVPKKHWAFSAVEAVTNAGVMEGHPQGFFHGDAVLTRYEFAVALARIMLNTGDPARSQLSQEPTGAKPE